MQKGTTDLDNYSKRALELEQQISDLKVQGEDSEDCQGIRLILDNLFHPLWTNCLFGNHAHNLSTLVM